MSLSWKWKTVFILLLLALVATGAEAIVLWNQVGDLQAQLSATRRQIANYRRREEEARRIDTSVKKSMWLLRNKERAVLGEISRPKGLSSILTSLWEDSYSPRKGHIYDVAFVEWRMSGRTKKQAGEESAEVLWVATIINSSRALGFDMSLELEFLDEKEFRITKDRAQGYLFPKTEDDRELSRETKLRGSFWVPLNLAKQIKRTEGVWRATPR